MQTLKKFYFGKQKAKVNTYIGGIGATINTPSLLANKLAISVNRIKLFKVTGVDVECAIIGSYNMPISNTGTLSGWGVGPEKDTITTFIDMDGLVSSISRSFAGNPVLKQLYFPNCTSIIGGPSGGWMFTNSPMLDYLCLPRCTMFGETSGQDEVFRSGFSVPRKIYVPVSLQTNNLGSPDGDLQRATLQGAEIIYVTNFNSPNTVTNLSSGTVYNATVQLNFTPPSSINGISFYECYANGKFVSEIKNSGDFITGLTPNTFYIIQIKAVDIFYNKSSFSNSVNITTTNRVATDVDAIAYTNASENSVYQDIVDDLFIGLKAQGLYTKIQSFYPFLGTTQAQHKWNGKSPLDTNAAFRLQFFGGGAHSNLGYQCNGTNAYANTFLVPSAVQNVNSNGLTVTVGTNNATTQNDVVEIGSFVSVTQASLITAKSNNTTFRRQSRMNGVSIFQDNQNDAKGVYTSSKQSSIITKLVRSKVEIANGNSGGTLSTVSVFIGNMSLNGNPYTTGWSNQRIQFTAIHEGLTNAEVLALHTIIDNFEVAIGRKTW